MSQPNFITRMDDYENLTLLVRLPHDRDFFVWGEITETQRDTLAECGVFELNEEE